MFAASAVYVPALDIIGYVVATTLLSVAVLRVLGGKKWWLDVALSLALSLGSYLLFANLLEVPLPKGILNQIL